MDTGRNELSLHLWVLCCATEPRLEADTKKTGPQFSQIKAARKKEKGRKRAGKGILLMGGTKRRRPEKRRGYDGFQGKERGKQ